MDAAPSPHPIAIRPYRPADLDALIELFKGSVRRVARRDYSHEQVMAWAPDEVDRDRWAARLAGRTTFVAEVGGEAAGFSDLEDDGHIDMMFVHADHQGRGVAGALLDHVEAEAVARGLTRVFTEASLTARPFFAHRGFRVIEAQLVWLRGQELANFRMEKHLSRQGRRRPRGVQGGLR